MAAIKRSCWRNKTIESLLSLPVKSLWRKQALPTAGENAIFKENVIGLSAKYTCYMLITCVLLHLVGQRDLCDEPCCKIHVEYFEFIFCTYPI